MKTIFLIAGEPSGDLLGASLIREFQTRFPTLKIAGIGGPEMEHAGQFTSFFPMEELSHMGIWEILPHLPHLLRRIRETTGHVLDLQPDALITLDAPDFCLRVAKKIKASNPTIPLVHCVAPSVWAWRPKRAKKIAQFLDHLFALFPFEPPYFDREGLPCTFVGHPLLEQPQGKKTSFYAAHPQLPSDAPLLCVLPGSRRREVLQHLPIFAETVIKIRQVLPHLNVVIPTVPAVERLVQEGLSLFPSPAPLVLLNNRFDAFAAADAALAASGTVTLELAFHETPFVVAYRISKLTEILLRRLVLVSHVCLVNLICQRSVVPECLQKDCNPDTLAKEILPLLMQSKAHKKQKKDLKEVIKALKADKPFSQKAAETIEKVLSRPSLMK